MAMLDLAVIASVKTMVGIMSKKTGIDAFSRRAFLRSAAAVGATAFAVPAMAQTAIDELINAPRRGNWDDQFDANASRSSAAIVSTNPVLGPGAVANVQQAIYDYQTIVANGGWPVVIGIE